jgi:hypothetical protein
MAQNNTSKVKGIEETMAAYLLALDGPGVGPVSTSITTGGLKYKLSGALPEGDTDEAIVRLWEKQTDEVKVSAPKVLGKSGQKATSGRPVGARRGAALVTHFVKLATGANIAPGAETAADKANRLASEFIGPDKGAETLKVKIGDTVRITSGPLAGKSYVVTDVIRSFGNEAIAVEVSINGNEHKFLPDECEVINPAVPSTNGTSH